MTSRQSATDDSSTDDDGASQTTEDDPQIPESQHVPPPAQLHPPPVAPQPAPSNPPPPTNAHTRARPRYELRHTLRGHTMSISSVKFSPDGTLLASCGTLRPHFPSTLTHATRSQAADNVAKIWSPFSGELIRNLNGHTKGLSDIAWSPDSVYLATASDDHTIRIWDVDSVRTIREIDKSSVFLVLKRACCGRV